VTERRGRDRRERPRGGWHGPRRGPRPPWWPDGEPWPPNRRRGGWRGFGCLFGLLFVVGFLGLVSLAANLVGGILDARGPVGTFARLAAVIVAVALLVSIARAGRALRRSGAVLDELVDVASRVEAGDYSARVRQPVHGPRPVRDLVRAFDTMAARLEADEDQRRSLLADVTHELRTPLAVVQGNLEAIIDGVHPADQEHLSAIPDETHVLTRLVEVSGRWPCPRPARCPSTGSRRTWRSWPPTSRVPSRPRRGPRVSRSGRTWTTACRCWTSIRSGSAR
jgi:signal transduction histidine kinase